MHLALRFLCLLFLTPLLTAQELEVWPGPPPGEPAEGMLQTPITDYDIQVTLNPKDKTLTGTQVLHYTNTSPDLIGDLVFHTYLNASANFQSTYWQERIAQEGVGDTAENPDNFGYMHITRASIAGVHVTDRGAYIQAPDSAPGDRTVWRLPLSKPLLPGETVTTVLEFTAKLPYAWDRVGWYEECFMAVQWFPKLAVWETKGMRGAEKAGWNAHAFHRYAEFYANFGNYKVAVTAPDNFVIGATGNRIGMVETKAGTLHTFQQSRVHDFAFTASPRYKEIVKTFQPSEWITEDEIQAIMRLHGLAREAVVLDPVEITLLMQPEHEAQAERHFLATCQGLKYFGLWYGKYPYKTLTVVDTPRVPHRGNILGGMEYPTFITIGTRKLNLATDQDLEDLIVHEFGHQYWYGLVGTNEFEEPWLDEGFNTYSTARVLDQAWPLQAPHNTSLGVPDTAWHMLMPDVPTPSEIFLLDKFDKGDTFPELRFSLADRMGFKRRTHRQRTIDNALNQWGHDRMRQNAWAYSAGNYWVNAYSKPAAMLFQLEHELGEETMARIMRTWLQENMYQHPNTDDFIALVNRIAEKDMSWFFSELMDKAAHLDYAVESITRVDYPDNIGWFDSATGPELRVPSDEAAYPNTSKQQVHVRNHGNIHYPVAIDVLFSDNTSERLNWDGDTAATFSFVNREAITEVIIDPEGKLLLDTNRANNSFRIDTNREASQGWSAKLLLGVQNILQTIGGGL